MGYAGFDTSIYPGDAVMTDWIQSTNLVWAGFYLGRAPSHSNTSWMTKLTFLQSLGWSLVPIYVGQQESGGPGSHHLSSTQGQLDGLDACSLAATAGFRQGQTLFLDVEASGPISSAMGDYIAAWSQEVLAGNFAVGIYCAYTSVASVQATGIVATYWVYRVKTVDVGGTKLAPFKTDDPTGAHADADLWQWAQDCQIASVAGPIQIDLNTSLQPDPAGP